VINHNSQVASEKRSRVLKAMKQLGYKPNAFAQALVTNRSNSIGMVLGDMSGWFPGSMVQGVEQIIGGTGMHLIVCNGHAKAHMERQATDFLVGRRCDALIAHIDALSDEELVDISKQYQTPIILINRYIHELADHCVYLKNEFGGTQATEYLIKNGHTDIACITGPLRKADSRERLQGYRHVLEKHDILYRDELVVEGDFLEEGGVKATKRLLERNKTFTAIFFCNVNMAIGGLSALKEVGLRVPDDVSIVGFDNALMARYITPQLSTVEMPINAMAHSAAQLALSHINNTSYEDIQKEFIPQLIIRDSVTVANR
jgi:LacI family transcriptional regulator